MRQYGFSSYELFQAAFMEEFGEDPANYTRDDDRLDVEEYYEKNNTKVRLKKRCLPARVAVLHSIEETEDEEVPADLTGRVLYWFHREFRDFARISKFFTEPEIKMSIWGNDAIFEGDHRLYRYYAGSFLKDDITEEEIDYIRENTHVVIERVPGGKYAEFRTMDENDEVKPEKAYHLLTLTAFGGWINENRWRTDLNRRTFVVWRGHKLFFYVPIVR